MAEEYATMTFNILLRQIDSECVAHCLELDIVGTGKTKDEAVKELSDLIATQVDYAFNNDNLDNLFHPAPVSAWKGFAHCVKQSVEKITIPNEFAEGDGLAPSEVLVNTCHAG